MALTKLSLLKNLVFQKWALREDLMIDWWCRDGATGWRLEERMMDRIIS